MQASEFGYDAFMAAAVKWKYDRTHQPKLIYPLVLEAMSGNKHDCKDCSNSNMCQPEHECCKDYLLGRLLSMGWASRSVLGDVSLSSSLPHKKPAKDSEVSHANTKQQETWLL